MTRLDRAATRLAEGQHGVISRGQARQLGFSSKAIDYRLKAGIWRRVLPSVYGIAGSSSTWAQGQIAACLWVPDGLAAGRAAGRLYQLPRCENSGVEIMTSSRRKIPRGGLSIKVHHTNWLPHEQFAIIDRIPVTSVERTLMSLSNDFERRDASILFDQALTRGLTTLGAIDRHLYFTARKGRDGCGKLREIAKDRLTVDRPPDSPLETVVFEMLVEEGLPLPKLQFEIHDLAGRFVARPDFVYPEQKLIIEAHSRLWHDGLEISKRDVERHNHLISLGHRVIYVTWADATRHSRSTADLVRRMLRDPLFSLARPPQVGGQRTNLG